MVAYARSLVGDLPNVPARVPETGSSDPPRSIYRSVQEVNPMLFQFLARRVDVVHAERELEPNAGVPGRHSCRLDEPGCLAGLQQVNERFTEPEHRRVVVLERHRQLEDLPVKALRRRQLLHEQRDRNDSPGPRSLFAVFPLSHVHLHFSSLRSTSEREGARPEVVSICHKLAASEIIAVDRTIHATSAPRYRPDVAPVPATRQGTFPNTGPAERGLVCA